MSMPLVAIVGAPNSGKSTLFNRLIGRRRAIVSRQPGVTRDRIAGECDLSGVRILLVDTGGIARGEDDLTRQVGRESLRAASEADLVLFLIDARAGLTAGDLDVAQALRAAGRPVIPVANKIDTVGQEGLELELYRLGFGEVVAVSAEQGRGMNELQDRILDSLPTRESAPAVAGIPVAIIGRPNVGKSSLFNRIARQDRAIVSPSPGTTRDPVDATFERSGTKFRIIDTAGIRRRARTGDEIEWVSVVKARQSIREAEVVIAMVDATAGIGHQDLALLGGIERDHKPVILAVNKIDLLPAREATVRDRLEEFRAALRFAPHVPVAGLSALTGLGVEPLMDTVIRLLQESSRRFTTAELNRALQMILREKQPPADGGREVRLLYMTQARGAPPRFLVFGNGRRVKRAYRRFMSSRLRTLLDLEGTPVVLSFRGARSR